MEKDLKIVTVNKKEEEKFLRRKVACFNFEKFSRKEISDLTKKMREIMIKANGIGLAANQIGLDLKVFVAQIQKFDKTGTPRTLRAAEQKFYAIFNPEIVKSSSEKTTLEEGCLSVPNAYGEVSRPEKITLQGFDKNSKKIKIKAWGLLARVFQHEVDHLNGILYVDKCKKLHTIEKSEIQSTKS